MSKREKDFEKVLKEFETALGKAVRENREKNNWSLGDFALTAGIEKNQLLRIEKGKHSATLRTLLAISLALRKYPHKLLDLGIPLNFDFDNGPKGKTKPRTKEIIFELLNGNFFDTPQSVDAVAKHCKKIFQVDLLKPAISAIVKDMVEQRKLTRSKDPNSRSFVYKKRIK